MFAHVFIRINPPFTSFIKPINARLAHCPWRSEHGWTTRCEPHAQKQLHVARGQDSLHEVHCGTYYTSYSVFQNRR